MSMYLYIYSPFPNSYATIAPRACHARHAPKV